jgi:multiple sugar transport system permease protein
MLIALTGVLWWLHPHPAAELRSDLTEVTLWFNGPIEGRQLDVVDAFERRFPAYRAVLGSSAVRTGLEGEGNPQRLMCGIAGGVPPEVVEYDRFAICQWAARGAFRDLSDLIQKDLDELKAARERLAQLEQSGAPAAQVERQREHVALLERFIIRPDDFFPATWDECSYEREGSVGQYGIPNYMDNRVMYYNADMLRQVGYVDAEGRPLPPKSWEQILTKRIDVTDATIAGDRITSASSDFVAAGVRPGDTISHISDRGQVLRGLVERVDGPNELTVRSPYRNKRLSLPESANQHIKVFDQDGYALRLSQWDDDGRIRRVGFEPQHGNAWLYLYGWANGGEFLSDDGRTCTLNDPRIVEALQWTTDVFDAYGGAADVVAFRKSFQTAAQDPFFINQIGLLIHGDWFLRDLARYKRDMDFGTAPPPVPQRRIDAGGDPITWVAGFAYCIPSTCPPEKLEAAWWLIKFLSSVEGGMVMNDHDAQRERGQGRLYMPRLVANRNLLAAQMQRYVDIPEMPERVRTALQTHLDLLPYSRYRPVSPMGQELWNAQADTQDQAWNHVLHPTAGRPRTVAEIADSFTARVQRALDEFLGPPRGRPMSWTPVVWLYIGAIVVVSAGVYLHHRSRHPAVGHARKEWWAGLMFAAPWLVGFLVLSGGPMVFSAVMSLTDYDVINPARFVGTAHYEKMFGPDWGDVGGTRDVLGNTLFMALGLPIGMAVGLALAMLLSAEIRGMSVYRTLFFLPAIMPIVAASVLWIWVFNAQNGMMNWMLELTGIASLIDWANANVGFPLRTPISWLTDPRTSKPALILMGLWGAGASMIIWLAGLKEIPRALYEAAALDGAGPVRRFFTVTLPMLSPYILFNLVIGLIATFQIFTQAYIMTPNGSPNRSTYFYVYKLFDQCFTYFNLGYGAAMAWVLFVIVIVLTLINMAMSKRWVHYAGE